MILVSFFSEDNVLSDEIKICYIFEFQSNENRAFRFFWGDTRYRLQERKLTCVSLRGVCWALFLQCGLAWPVSSRSLTRCVKLNLAASCSGVFPRSLVWLTLAPFCQGTKVKGQREFMLSVTSQTFIVITPEILIFRIIFKKLLLVCSWM